MVNTTISNGSLKIFRPTCEYDLNRDEIISLLQQNYPVLINVNEELLGRRVARQFIHSMQEFSRDKNMVLEFISNDIIMIEPNK